MKPLSYSSVSDYQRCPLYYRLVHLDGHKPAPQPYFSFGSSLHAALEYMYGGGRMTPPTLEDLLDHLNQAWESEGYESNQQEQDYRGQAREILTDFYQRRAPQFRPAFTVEKKFLITVGGVPFTGYIDRVDKLDGGGLKIVDYKSGVEPFTREQMEGNSQLTLYQIACEELYGLPVETLSLYHLRSQTEFETASRDEQAKAQARDWVTSTASLIQAERFDPKESTRCPCEFGRYCPNYAHQYPPEQLSLPEEVDIRQVVDEYLALKGQAKESQHRIEELGERIKRHCELHGLNRIFGSGEVAVTRSVCRVVEWDGELATPILKQAGLWDAVSRLDQGRLRSLVESGEVDQTLVERLEAGKREQIRVSLYAKKVS